MAKTLKKLLSLTIAVIMILSLIPAVSAAELTTETGDDGWLRSIVSPNGSTVQTANEAGWFEINNIPKLNAWLFSSPSEKYIILLLGLQCFFIDLADYTSQLVPNCTYYPNHICSCIRTYDLQIPVYRGGHCPPRVVSCESPPR